MNLQVLPDPYRQVESLLDMLRRRPDEDFDKFCEALVITGQAEVVEVYLKPGKSTSSLGGSSSKQGLLFVHFVEREV